MIESERRNPYVADDRRTRRVEQDALTQDVIAVIAREQKLPPEAVTPSSSFADLKIDSLDGINIVFALEEKYNLTIPDEVAREMKTVGQVIEALREALAKNLQSSEASATPA
jgi:acyl carrier protein